MTLSTLKDQAKSTAAKLYTEEDGGELLEYAMIAGLIVVAAIGAVKLFGTTLRTKMKDMEGAVKKESFKTTN
jgi:Flp pilus assembly pilin Flp